MMKFLSPVLVACAASPALAHVGVHSHPHATETTSLPMLFVGLALLGVTAFCVMRRI